ncbi:prepilin peptidase [Roseburia hominis]
MIVCLEIVLGVFRFLMGACIFSFVNVVICRLPRGESVATGRSHCMECGHELAARELIPLVSYLVLRGKCSQCGVQIPIRDFMVECTGGAAFALSASFYGIGKTGVISLRGLLVFAFLAVLMIVAAIDWDTRIIYDRFHIIIGILGLAAVWLFPEITLKSRLIGLLVISVPMLLLALLIPDAFGGGDIKLMAACGWYLGWKANVFAMFVGLLTAGIYCGVMLAAGKLGRKEHFAFGPFLAAGLAVAAFCGEWAGNWYLSLL